MTSASFRSVIWVFAVSLGLLVANSAMADDLEAVRSANNKRLEALVAKDPVKLSALYASDGLFMIPNAPTVEGEQEIQKAWRDLFALPEFSMTHTIVRIDVAESSDLAMDLGRYEFSFKNGDTDVVDRGKYLIVWTLIDGQWRIAADMFSSNGPS